MVIRYCDRCGQKVQNKRKISICIDEICKEFDFCAKCVADLKIKPKIMQEATKDELLTILNQMIKKVVKQEIQKIQEPFQE
jgi:hypothetical protein